MDLRQFSKQLSKQLSNTSPKNVTLLFWSLSTFVLSFVVLSAFARFNGTPVFPRDELANDNCMNPTEDDIDCECLPSLQFTNVQFMWLDGIPIDQFAGPPGQPTVHAGSTFFATAEDRANTHIYSVDLLLGSDIGAFQSSTVR